MPNKFKVGDMVVLNGDLYDPAYAKVVQTMTEGKAYEVLSVGTPPAGWYSNVWNDEEDVYFFDDIGRQTCLFDIKLKLA